MIRTFPLSINLGMSGYAATLYYEVINAADGSAIIARTNADVTEWGTSGQYYLVASWDDSLNVLVQWDETVTGAKASESWPAAVRPPTVAEISAQVTTDHGAGSYVAPTDYQQRGQAVTLPATPPDGYGRDEGTGETPVDHDTGGTDNLRYVASGDGVEAGLIRAYLSSEYNAGTYTQRGETTTRDDGRWAEPMYLSSGLTYTITFAKPGVYQVSTQEVTL